MTKILESYAINQLCGTEKVYYIVVQGAPDHVLRQCDYLASISWVLGKDTYKYKFGRHKNWIKARQHIVGQIKRENDKKKGK